MWRACNFLLRAQTANFITRKKSANRQVFFFGMYVNSYFFCTLMIRRFITQLYVQTLTSERNFSMSFSNMYDKLIHCKTVHNVQIYFHMSLHVLNVEPFRKVTHLPPIGSFNIKLYEWSKGKSVPLRGWSGPQGSRKLMFPDFMTTAQGCGKVVSLTHRPHLPPGNPLVTHFC